MKKIISLAITAIIALSSYAQKADLGNSPITWLGIDISQLKFLGNAAQWKDAGQITNEDMKNKYARGWNELFLTDKKKYDVAGAVHKNSVDYATDITENANNNIKDPNFFTQSSSDLNLLNEQKVSAIVSHYDFKGKTGVGLMIFAEGMSKDAAEGSMWVAFVDMGSKRVLVTKRLTEKAGGFGFRNYWAKTFYNALDDIKDNFDSWKKEAK